jgi:hypothetical protein
MFCLRKTLFLIMLTFSISILANDPPKEEHASGEGEKPAEGKTPGTAVNPGWTEIINNITQIDGKITVGKQNIEKLLATKAHTPSESPQLRQITDDLIREHNELRKNIMEQNKLKQRLRYKYPEMGAKEGRSYQEKKIPTMNELEIELGVDGKLDRNLRKMRSQFGTVAPAPSEENSNKKKDSESERIILEK